jgi:hypothetical protein
MLVPGYGEPSWLGNVALVQSSPYELGELAEAEREHSQALNSPLPGDPTVAVWSLYTVDQEFLDVVYRAVSRVDL